MDSKYIVYLIRQSSFFNNRRITATPGLAENIAERLLKTVPGNMITILPPIRMQTTKLFNHALPKGTLCTVDAMKIETGWHGRNKRIAVRVNDTEEAGWFNIHWFTHEEEEE
jgi:hypothetical protein